VSPTVATVNEVDITSSGFNPAIISVPIGTQVKWTNRDSVSHTVANTGFNSGSISPGNTFSRTFSTSGSYDYGDPSNSSWSGTVIVT
jgi:plastocyanin